MKAAAKKPGTPRAGQEKPQVKLSRDSFADILAEMLSGPCTSTALADASGMGHRYVNRLMKTLHGKGVVHIAGWEKDSLGRQGMRTVWALGHGRDAKREKATKPRAQVQRDYRARQQMAPLKGTPFYGLTV